MSGRVHVPPYGHFKSVWYFGCFESFLQQNIHLVLGLGVWGRNVPGMFCVCDSWKCILDSPFAVVGLLVYLAGVTADQLTCVSFPS